MYILDHVYTNRPDMYSAHVLKSLIETKHMAVIVAGTDSRSVVTQNERKLRFMTYVHPTLIV